MSKRKTMDKAQARERRNRLLESAAAAELSLTEGVREMRAISGMTQEEFARHREVSARVIKALELGQGNPTVATLNRIGKFFGLEVAFVPVRRTVATDGQPEPSATSIASRVPVHLENRSAKNSIVSYSEKYMQLANVMAQDEIEITVGQRNDIVDGLRKLSKVLTVVDKWE